MTHADRVNEQLNEWPDTIHHSVSSSTHRGRPQIRSRRWWRRWRWRFQARNSSAGKSVTTVKSGVGILGRMSSLRGQWRPRWTSQCLHNTLPYLSFLSSSLPYLSLCRFPCLTLAYLSLSYLTIACLSFPYLALSYLSLSYRTLTHLSFPYLTLL